MWRASNGEEIHGYLWQSVRLLAYDTGALDGRRKSYPDDLTGQTHVFKVCKPSWWLAPQSRDDCSHAAGHGFLYAHTRLDQSHTHSHHMPFARTQHLHETMRSRESPVPSCKRHTSKYALLPSTCPLCHALPTACAFRAASSQLLLYGHRPRYQSLLDGHDRELYTRS
jgi:hypothetical protein